MPQKSKRSGAKTCIKAIKHQDKRSNIPTEELRDFVKEEETRPKTVRYPRDPSLDPQLVWKGKDEQDQNPLEVPAVPVYIQEKIAPQILIEDLRTNVGATGRSPEPQGELFADFNGIAFDKMVEFYQHEQNWANRMILGDSLLVMTSLAEKEGLKGKVQMIYLDPPYGIKFGSNWQVSTRKRDIKDGKAEDATRQPEQIRAFRDTWKLGIHSYLSYLRDRLAVARELLTESGSIFVQIGDENVHLVRNIMDEVFGSENFCAMIHFKSTTSQTTELVAGVGDYILWYAKEKDMVKYRQLFSEKDLNPSAVRKYAEFSDGTRKTLTIEEQENFVNPAGSSKLFVLDNITSQSGGETTRFKVTLEGGSYLPDPGFWKTSAAGMEKLRIAKRLGVSGKTLRYVRFVDDFPVSPVNALWTDTSTGSFTDPKVYVVQTNTKVAERCMLMTTDPGDLMLDPTCGSGTTAFVAEQLGRRWITIDTSRVALALARTRLMAAKFPYYLLADSPDGQKKEAELTGQMVSTAPTNQDVKKGFVSKRVPHVTLKSIANNPEIKAGMTREEIDAAIARHADTEFLYDQPYEEKNKIRVSGPFTVESLSPHRNLSTDFADYADKGKEKDKNNLRKSAQSADAFVFMILENLRKAGVQNTIKNERLTFDRLEPYAGLWIHAAGEYTEKDGKSRRAAVCIGPEHGTVGPELVKEAAKEAVKGIGFDLLLVCGFAFDPHVSEEAKQYGKLTVLLPRMNPDLSMGEEFLKKTGAGNLFMVFGEPDLEVKKQKDGKLVVEIKGVDVYDPTTGQIRSHTKDDIACWFIDTNYNSESFFVRHAYFTGAGDPLEKLKRALRAEVDEAAWSALYSTKSRPFAPPKTGKIAVKVINHYGDEVLKVYELK